MIYFMRAGETGHVKIGWTKSYGTLAGRQAALQTGQPHQLNVIRTMEDAPRWAELWLHGFFAGVRATGEWFQFQKEMMTVKCPTEEPHRSTSSGTSSLTRHFGIRIPLELWGRLETHAAERGVSVAAILLEPWEKQPKLGRPLKPVEAPQEVAPEPETIDLPELTVEPDPDYADHEARPVSFDHRPMGQRPVKKGKRS